MSKKTTTIFYVVSYAILISLSIAVFFLFRPFSYIDNDHSYIHCFNNPVNYETSPNLIFLLDKKLDSFNDIKARKLCKFSIINDYINSFETPKEINYELLPAYSNYSSWPQAVFVFIIMFFVGSISIKALSSVLKFKRNEFSNKFIKTVVSIFEI